MKAYLVSALLAALAVALLVAGCTSAAPPPAPTKAPAAPAQSTAPTKAPVEPTKAAAVQPTAAPAAKKVDYPTPGKSITHIVPFAAGGGTDITARVLAPFLEKQLGAPISVLNKAGGNTQVGMTELAKAKPDGYTLGTVDVPSVNISYLLKDRGAPYTRKDFMPLWMYDFRSPGWAVKADSPFKTVKDVIDAAKAKPESIKVASTGLQGPWHLASLSVEKASGAKFTHVHFDGGGPSMTALLGGHVDIATTSPLNAASAMKSGQIRMLGILNKERDKFFADIPTFKEQGYDITYVVWYPVTVPAGTPKEVAEVLIAALKKIEADPEFKKRTDDVQATIAPRMTPAEIEALWAEYDTTTAPLLEMVKQ